MKLLYVEWIDSSGPREGGWIPMENYDPKPLYIQSVGFLWIDGKDAITLIAHQPKEDQPSAVDQGKGIITIPKVAIVSLEKLEIPSQTVGEMASSRS